MDPNTTSRRPLVPHALRSALVGLVSSLDANGVDGVVSRSIADSLRAWSESKAVSKDAQALVEKAIAQLETAFVEEYTPVQACTSTICDLSQALELLASPSSAAGRHPSIAQTGIPTEILQNIFQTALGSSTDVYREHQKLMLAIALVSRSFHVAIAPTLRTTIHITSGAQLPRLDRVLAEDNARATQITTLYVALDVSTLKRSETGSWDGRYLQPALSHLQGTIKTAFVCLTHGGDEPETYYSLKMALENATGGDGDLLTGKLFSSACELHLQHMMAGTEGYAFDDIKSEHLMRLYVDVKGAFRALESTPSRDGLATPRRPWVVLAIPYHIFPIPTLRNLLPIGTSTLHHLQVTLRLPPSCSDAIEELGALFAYLAPSLVYLTLRLDGISIEPSLQPVVEALGHILQPCDKLETLAISCHGNQYPASAVVENLHRLCIPTITFLPFYQTTRLHGTSQLSLIRALSDVLQDGFIPARSSGPVPGLVADLTIVLGHVDRTAVNSRRFEYTSSVRTVMEACHRMGIQISFERQSSWSQEYYRITP